MINRGTIVLLIIAFVAALIIGILYATNRIDTAQTLEIAALTTLVLITAWYAKQTTIMAKEMRKQRYDAVRPVIDIQRDPADDVKISEAIAISEGDASRGLSSVLHNIGLGPAIDLYSFVQNPFSGERQRHEFGTLAIGNPTYRMKLSLIHEGSPLALVAYYRDVYGRALESSREVTFNKEKTACEIGPLHIRQVTEDELP